MERAEHTLVEGELELVEHTCRAVVVVVVVDVAVVDQSHAVGDNTTALLGA